jgi:hypothetical protein
MDDVTMKAGKKRKVLRDQERRQVRYELLSYLTNICLGDIDSPYYLFLFVFTLKDVCLLVCFLLFLFYFVSGFLFCFVF